MRRTLLALLILLMACTFFLTLYVYIADAEKIKLEWDLVENVDGYFIYQSYDQWNVETKQAEHRFDYGSPIKTDEYPDGRIPNDITSITVDLPGFADADTRYFFTARSFRGEEMSADSNEVNYVVALTIPPAPGDLAGSFDKDAGVINVSWAQAVEQQSYRTISHWIVYCRQQETEEWKPVGRINQDHELSIEMPISAIMTGDKATLEFVIVAYRRSGVYSQNSDILSIEIDRTDVPPIQNLRINIELPID